MNFIIGVIVLVIASVIFMTGPHWEVKDAVKSGVLEALNEYNAAKNNREY